MRIALMCSALIAAYLSGFATHMQAETEDPLKARIRGEASVVYGLFAVLFASVGVFS